MSYDFVDGDADPVSGVDDWHGTRCAGLVSAAKDGEACGVGVAYNAKFGGVCLFHNLELFKAMKNVHKPLWEAHIID